MVMLSEKQKQAVSKLLVDCGSTNKNTALKAQAEFAKNVELPIRKAVLSGDIIGDIFSVADYRDSQLVIYPMDIIGPGQEDSFYATVVPDHGMLPEKRVQGSYLTIPTFDLGNSIDAQLKLLRDANWPVVERMIEVFEAGFVKKLNDNGWQTILTAAKDRNTIVTDENAANGQFTPRLIALMANVMRRNGGGNSASVNRSKLTDLYVSPEAHLDIKSWGLDLIPDQARANIYYASEDDQDLIKVYGINIHARDEFGEGQEYQNYYTNTLSGTMTSGDVEIVVGLDLSRKDSFIMPLKEELRAYPNDMLHIRNLFGIYGRMEVGFAALDSRRSLLGSL